MKDKSDSVSMEKEKPKRIKRSFITILLRHGLLFLKKTIYLPVLSYFRYYQPVLSKQKAFFTTLVVTFFIVLSAHFIIMLEHGGFSGIDMNEFEVGKVADRDIIASRDIVYTDKSATAKQRAARMRLIAPVFRQSNEAISAVLHDYDHFTVFLLGLKEANDNEDITAAVKREYGSMFDGSLIAELVAAEDLNKLLVYARSIIQRAVSAGIIEFPQSGLEKLNADEITLLIRNENKNEYMDMQTRSFVQHEYINSFVKHTISLLAIPLDVQLAATLISPFLRTTVFYDERETQNKIADNMKHIPPVTVTIPKNQRIIKRGFIITAEHYQQLQEYRNAGVYLDITKFFGILLFIFLLYGTGLFIFSEQMIHIAICKSQRLFLLLISVFVYLSVLIDARYPVFSQPMDILPVIPAALASMLVVTLLSVKIAVAYVFFTSILVLTASGFQLEPALFSIFSGLAAAYLMDLTVKRPDLKRIDLIKTACQLAGIHPIITIILLVIFPASSADNTAVVIGTGISGFMSGIVLLGLLAILEDRMNTATYFRLREIADRNSAIIESMRTMAPGTYNHSMEVAKLAEIACKSIGANSLLARAGAVYHDIGKIGNRDYFIENQTGYNKHWDLNPRLSATIIRSHVKIGVEEAEKLRLPREVIDIIEEHHGNGLVGYFYVKAKELDPNVDAADFSYPGRPPRTKESAVVMLADMTEAACRSLDNPTYSRLKKFIGDLIKKKIESGQLDDSELTFRELKSIETSFVDTLASHYHSRIKYPNQKDPDEKEKEAYMPPAVKELSPEEKKYIAVDVGLDAPAHPVTQEDKDE